MDDDRAGKLDGMNSVIPEHYIVRCKGCQKIIGQCRCNGSKKLSWTLCRDCKRKMKNKKGEDVTTKELLQRIESIFSGKLSRKTGWGKNEVLVALKDSIKEALMETID